MYFFSSPLQVSNLVFMHAASNMNEFQVVFVVIVVLVVLLLVPESWKKTLSQKFVQSFVKLVKGIFKRWNNFRWKCVHTKAMDHYCISLHNISKNVLFIESYHKGSFLGVQLFRDYCFLGVQFSWCGFRGLGVHFLGVQFFRGMVFGCGLRGLGVGFSKNTHFWAFLRVRFFRGTAFWLRF